MFRIHFGARASTPPQGPPLDDTDPALLRIVAVAVLVIGLVLQLWLWQRGRLELQASFVGTASETVKLCGIAKYDRDSFTRDQVQLLAPATWRAAGGELLPFSKRMSGGGIVPGSLLQILIGEPLKLVYDYRAASAVIVLLHLAAAGLVFGAAKQAMGLQFAVFFFALFWLSPWRLYHGGHLWEPAYILLPSALHLWAHGRAIKVPAFWPSLVLALALAIAPQLHGSAVILFLITAWLMLTGRFKIHWPGAFAGGIVGLLPLAPTAWAWAEGSLDWVDESHESTTDRNPLRWLYRLPRALGYWIRLGSFDVGRRYRQTSFLSDQGEPVAYGLAALIAVAALVTALLTAYIGWQWMRGRLPRLPKDSFFHHYAVATFGAVMAAAVISPVTLQGWHVLVALPATLMPVTAWLCPRLLSRPGLGAGILGLSIACCALLGLGHPMYAEPVDGPCVVLMGPGATMDSPCPIPPGALKSHPAEPGHPGTGASGEPTPEPNALKQPTEPSHRVGSHRVDQSKKLHLGLR